MKKLINSFFLFLILAASTLPVFSQPSDTHRSEPYQVKNFSFKSGGSLSASTMGGDISVYGTDARNASVALVITDQDGNFNKAAIESALKEYTVDIRQENNKLIAHVSRNDGETARNPEIIVSMRIYVPKKTTCDLNTIGGSILLKDIKGGCKALTSGGGISLYQYAGILKVETDGGPIILDGAEGSLQLATAGGDINLKKVAGDIVAQSNGGDISADIRQIGKFLTLEATGGNVQATLPGNCNIDLDLAGVAVRTDLSDFAGLTEKDKIKGSVGGGGVPVKIHTITGQAELNYR